MKVVKVLKVFIFRMVSELCCFSVSSYSLSEGNSKVLIFTYSLTRFFGHCMRCPFIVNTILYIFIQYIKNEELGDWFNYL